MSDIQRIKSNHRMSQIVIHNKVIYLSGQVGTPGESVTLQTQEILAKIDTLLAEAGVDKTRILQTTIWLADMADFAELNAVYDAWVPQEGPSTRACGEAKLATPQHLVEIMIVAAQS